MDNSIPIPLEGWAIVLKLLRIPSAFRLCTAGSIQGEIKAFIVNHLPHLVGIL
jgi:hypothetical protein